MQNSTVQVPEEQCTTEWEVEESKEEELECGDDCAWVWEQGKKVTLFADRC